MISAFTYIIIAHFMRDKLFRQTKSASGHRFSVFSHHTKVKGKTPGKKPSPHPPPLTRPPSSATLSPRERAGVTNLGPLSRRAGITNPSPQFQRGQRKKREDQGG